MAETGIHMLKRTDTFEEERFEGTMYEAQCRCFEKAREFSCHILLSTFNKALGKWQHIGRYMPDFTGINSFGEHGKWTGDSNFKWISLDRD